VLKEKMELGYASKTTNDVIGKGMSLQLIFEGTNLSPWGYISSQIE
jgi:hypothetical protein